MSSFVADPWGTSLRFMPRQSIREFGLAGNRLSPWHSLKGSEVMLISEPCLKCVLGYLRNKSQVTKDCPCIRRPPIRDFDPKVPGPCQCHAAPH